MWIDYCFYHGYFIIKNIIEMLNYMYEVPLIMLDYLWRRYKNEDKENKSKTVVPTETHVQPPTPQELAQKRKIQKELDKAERLGFMISDLPEAIKEIQELENNFDMCILQVNRLYQPPSPADREKGIKAIN